MRINVKKLFSCCFYVFFVFLLCIKFLCFKFASGSNKATYLKPKIMISNNKILSTDNTFDNLLELRNQLKYGSKKYTFLTFIIKQHIKEVENKNQEFIKLYYKN